MKKRILSAFMALCLMMALLPTAALAEEPQLRRLNYWHYLYEYNPMTKEYVRVSGEQSSALRVAREDYGITPEHSSTNRAPIPEGVKVPQGNDDQVTISERYGLPQMTYAYEGVDYTWLCTGYEIDDVVYKWTEDELDAGIAKKDFSSKAGQILTIYYHWVQIEKLEENAPANFDTVTFTFDYGKHIIDDDSQGPGPNVELTIPEECDFFEATVTLYGSNSRFDFPSQIRDAIDNGQITQVGAEDGIFTASWPKGYYFTLDDLLKNQPNGYSHYYIKISCTPYEWYGHIEGWRDSAGEYFSDGAMAEESATFYARYHTNSDHFSRYVAAEGHTLVSIGNANSLEENSAWSNEEFQAVRNQITVPGWNFPTYQIAVKNENWNITVPSPEATSVDENGGVLLSDGDFTWRCIGVQYEVYGQNAKTVFIPHDDWKTTCEIIVEDVTELDQYGYGGMLDLEYVWQVDWPDEPPKMYKIEYKFDLPDALSTVSGRRVFPVQHHDDDWGIYDAWDLASGDGDFYQNNLTNLQNYIAAANTEVRAGKNFTILEGATYDYRDFLAFNEKEDLYYDFLGWEDENGTIHEINTSMLLDDSADVNDDGTVTLTAAWEKFEALTDEEYKKAVNTLKFDILEKARGVDTSILITQWTDTDPNTNNNNRTGNPVALDENGIIYYQVSTGVNSSLLSTSDSQHITINNYAKFTFSLDIDPNLEFADEIKNSDGSVTLIYNNSYMKPTGTNLGDKAEISGPDADNNYRITFDPADVPLNSEQGIHLEFTVEMIVQKENDPNRKTSDPLTITGLAFQLKEGVATEDLVVETRGNVIGNMDLSKISTESYHLRFRYYDARNFLRNNDDWQALFGGETDPVAYIHSLQFMDKKLSDYDLSTDKMATLKANTVRAYGGFVTVTPADMTIYQGGEDGYEGVYGDGEADLGSDSLPHPLFKITMPTSAGNTPVTDLTFQTKDGTKSWKPVSAGKDAKGNDLYYFQEQGTTPPVRITYTNEDGVPVLSDDFQVGEDVQNTYSEYRIDLYAGENEEDFSNITANSYPISVGFGTLTVRAVEKKTGATSAIEETAPTTKLKAETASAVAPEGTTYTLNDTDVALPTDDTAKPSLLFDSIITSDGKDRIDALEKAVDEKVGVASGTRHYEAKYLDLVDANNGNAWISSSKGTDIYWGYPQGTGQSTTFTLIHFKDLHRDGTNSGFDIDDIDSDNVDILTTGKEIENTDYGIKFHVDKGGFSPFVLVWETAADPNPNPNPNPNPGGGEDNDSDPYLRFDSNGGTAFDPIESRNAFSINPYDDAEYGSHIPSRPGYRFTGWYRDRNLTLRVDEDRTLHITGAVTLFAGWEETSVPDMLNGDDHFAYIQGYADGSVRPNANITRAQVATIFFRLLDEDFRDDSLTTTNPFPDVDEDYWANTAISTMAALGVINGRNNGNFDPDASITRAEFAAICARFDDSGVTGTAGFTDISGHWAEAEIERAAALGWVQGYSDGSFQPNARITRAQAVTMINRVLCRLPEDADDLLSGMNTWTDCDEGDWYYLAIQEATNSHDYVAKDRVYESWTELNAAPDWSRYE